MQQIYLTGNASRAIRRLARRVPDIELEPVSSPVIQPLAQRWTNSQSRDLDGLRSMLLMGDHPFDLLVPSRGARVRGAGIRSSVCSVQLPESSFERVCVHGASYAALMPKGLDVLVDSPPLSFALAARQLSRSALHGNMSQQEADLRLFKLGIEECGLYALNPWNPLGGETCFKIPPATSAAQVQAYLSALHGFDGQERSKKVAEMLFDNVASQMEGLLVSAIGLPSHLGGMCMGRPEANAEIPLNELQRLMLNHTERLTPDLFWRKLGIILEYLGKEPHDSAKASEDDIDRVQDFQVLGYDVLLVDFRHMRSPEQFNQLAVRIAEVMGKRGQQNMRSWVDELVADPEFKARQRVLFMVMLPPVGGR